MGNFEKEGAFLGGVRDTRRQDGPLACLSCQVYFVGLILSNFCHPAGVFNTSLFICFCLFSF